MFGKRKALITITRSGLQIEVGKAPVLFTPSPAAYANLDVINDDTFGTEFKTFLEKQRIKGQTFVLYVTDEVIFQKDVALKDQALLESSATTFFDEVPFEEVATKTIVDPKTKTTRIVAANKKLIDLVRIGCESTNNKLFAVVAAGTIPFIAKKELHNGDIHGFLGNDGLLRSVNLVDVADHSEDPQNVDKAGFKTLLKNPIFQVILIILCFLAAGLLIMMAFGLVKNPFEAPVKKTPPALKPATASAAANPSASASNEASVSATPPSSEIVVPKTTLSITITNGTGTTGDATKVHDALTTRGYSATVSTKAVTAAVTDTEVSFGSAIPQVYKDDILGLLTELFGVAKTADQANLDPAAVAITTGSQKEPTNASAEAVAP